MPSHIASLRHAIILEAERRDLTRNAVAALVAGKVDRLSVYGFMDGTRDIATSSAFAIAAALGITITVRTIHGGSHVVGA